MPKYDEISKKPPELRQKVATFSVATTGLALMGAALAFAWAGSTATQAIGGFLLAAGLLLCALSRTGWLRLQIRVAALSFSLVLVIVVADICLRATTSFPINAASNQTPHPRLGYVLSSKMPDVDADGFRNENLKANAQIVAIGDSHTQGCGVPSKNSWPQVLGQLLNKTVYNLGVGGYGPLQYEILIDRALKLQPETIVVGLYAGNDFEETSPLNRHETADRDSNPFRQIIKHRTAVGNLCHYVFRQLNSNEVTCAEVAHKLNPTVISERRLKHLSDAMDLTSPNVKRGFNVTLQILSEANRKCISHNCRLIVLVIPTREFTYSTIVDTAGYSAGYQKLVDNEREVHRQTTSELRKQGISYANALPCLKAALNITDKVYAADNEDCPRESGQVAYAAAVMQLLSPTVAQR